jgi:hypothetical protein
MVTLPEKVQQFARWSGAKIRPEEKVELELDLPNFVADSERPPEESTESLVESKFERNTKPWKNPNITLGTAIGLAAVLSALGFFLFNSNVQWPSMGGPTLGNASQNDDNEPVAHPDGQVQTAALTGTLGPGFDNDANPKNPYITTVKPPASQSKGTLNPKGKVSRTTTPSTPPVVTTTPVVATAPRTMPRRSYTDYSDGAVTASTAYRPTRPIRQTVTPRASTGSTAAPAKTVEQRRAEAIAATTFNGGSSSASAQSGSTQTVAASPQEVAQGSVQGEPSRGERSKGEYLAAENAVIDGIPQQLVNRAKKAEGVLLQGLAFTPGDLKYLENQEVTAEISNPLDSGLPVGTQVIASIQFPQSQGQAKNAVVRLIPTAMVLKGSEYEIPAGSAILTAKGGKPFIAKRGGSELLRFLGSATKTVLGAGVGALTSLSGLGGGNILSSLTGLGGARGASTQANPTEALILKDNLPIQFSIIRPFSIPIAAEQKIQPVAEAPESIRFTQDLSDEALMAIASPQKLATQQGESVPQQEEFAIQPGLVTQPEEYTNAQ